MMSMIGLSKILLGTSALLSSYCGIQSNIVPSNPNSVELMQPQLLVEIRTTKSGMVDPSGELSSFRMYSSGEAEFEYHSSQIDKDKTNGYVKKKISLDVTDFEEIVALIAMNDYLATDPSYEYKKEFSDALTVTKIISLHDKTQKTIVLSETDSRLRLETKKSTYPASLIRLLTVVERLATRFHP